MHYIVSTDAIKGFPRCLVQRTRLAPSGLPDRMVLETEHQFETMEEAENFAYTMWHLLGTDETGLKIDGMWQHVEKMVGTHGYFGMHLAKE